MSWVDLEGSFNQVLKWLWNTLFHQCVAVITVYSLWFPIQHYSSPFSWHVILCTVGILPLLSMSLILFTRSNVWTQDTDKDSKRWLHVILAFLSFVFVITGIGIEIHRKDGYEISHFSSGHAIMGLLSMIFLIIAFVGGFLIFLRPLYQNFIGPIWFKLVHNIVGQVGYVFGLICLILGFYTDFFRFYSTQDSNISATIVTIIILAWSLFHCFKSVQNQIMRARSSY